MTGDSKSIPAPAGAAIADLMSELMAMHKEDPLAIERVAKLYDKNALDQVIAKHLLGILPAVIDAETMLQWLEGGCLPSDPIQLKDPEAGQPKSARGGYEALRGKLVAAEEASAHAKVKFGEARARVSALRRELDVAERHLRTSVFGRFMNAVAKQMAAAFALGPIWTLMRSISGYLQTDVEWENTLTTDEREELMTHRQRRKETATEILHLLDLHCGDEALEIEMNKAVLEVLRRVHAPVAKELEDKRFSLGELSARAKRVRRRSEDWRRSVHPNAKISDRLDVLDGLSGEGEAE
jgi:hypothetical protein